MTIKLYAVLLGGRAPKCNTELHDVVFVTGHNLEETYPLLIKKWFSDTHRLHIDSSLELSFVDNHEITLSPIPTNDQTNKSLYFVNIGGYKADFFGEVHHMGFFVAESKEQVLEKAKTVLGVNFLQQHCDDSINLQEFLEDDLIQIDKVDGYYINCVENHIDKPQAVVVSGYRKLDLPAIFEAAAKF